MLEKNELNKIKETAAEFFEKMTITTSRIDVGFSFTEREPVENQETTGDTKDAVNLEVKLEEPQILIGQGGQTLFEIQRLLKTILNKKLQKIFYLNLDINDYKKKKVEYLKEIAKDLANEVALTKGEKVLTPMSAYERRIIHAELSKRADVATESQGEGLNRHIVIKPK